MFCDLTLISSRAEADGASDGVGDCVSTDNNDDTSVFVPDDVLDGVDAEVFNAADGGDNKSCESTWNDAVVTDVAIEEYGVADVVVGNDDTASVYDTRLPRMKNIVNLKSEWRDKFLKKLKETAVLRRWEV